MRAIPRMDSDRLFGARTVDIQRPVIGQVASVGRWMTLLGVVRVSCAAALLLKACLDMWRGGETPLFPTDLSTVFTSPVVLLICMAWPLAIGLLVNKTGHTAFLRLASLTFFLLALVGFLRLAADWSASDQSVIRVGSFQMSRTNASGFGMLFLGLGLVQLLAELAMAWRAAGILSPSGSRGVGANQARTAMIPGEFSGWQTALVRGGWILAVLAVIPLVRVPRIPKVYELLDRSPMIRELLLINDNPRAPRNRGPRPNAMLEMSRDREIQQLVFDATMAWTDKRFEDARVAYQKAIELYRTMDESSPQRKANLAMLENNLAWLLVTRPDPRPEDAREAIAYAETALTHNTIDGYFWNTLGAAHYRANEWQEAKDALLRSMELRGDGDGFDWILLALVHAKSGRKDRALEWYQKAAKWRTDFRGWDHELYRFQVEAASILNLPKPSEPIPVQFARRRDDSPSMHKGRNLPMGAPLGDLHEHGKGFRQGGRRPSPEMLDLRKSDAH